MFKFQGIWLPDGEKHFPEWMTKNGEIVNGRGTYQIKKLRAAMEWCKQFRTAIDVGAHVGLWSMHLAQKFDNVHAFEPVPQFRECFVRNVGEGNTQLHDCALGDHQGKAHMVVNAADTGDTHVGRNGEEVLMFTLDSFGFSDVDFIKVDCEGYELEVLCGAVKTLSLNQPCVIVEQKQRKMEKNFGTKGTPAVDYLRDLGARVRREMGGDYIMSWD